jgi:hypothetical protein
MTPWGYPDGLVSGDPWQERFFHGGLLFFGGTQHQQRLVSQAVGFLRRQPAWARKANDARLESRREFQPRLEQVLQLEDRWRRAFAAHVVMRQIRAPSLDARRFLDQVIASLDPLGDEPLRTVLLNGAAAGAQHPGKDVESSSNVQRGLNKTTSGGARTGS